MNDLEIYYYSIKELAQLKDLIYFGSGIGIIIFFKFCLEQIFKFSKNIPKLIKSIKGNSIRNKIINILLIPFNLIIVIIGVTFLIHIALFVIGHIGIFFR